MFKVACSVCEGKVRRYLTLEKLELCTLSLCTWCFFSRATESIKVRCELGPCWSYVLSAAGLTSAAYLTFAVRLISAAGFAYGSVDHSKAERGKASKRRQTASRTLLLLLVHFLNDHSASRALSVGI